MSIIKQSEQKFETYEALSVHVLEYFKTELGLSHIQTKQTIPGNTGTSWEIDAKGISIDSDEGFLIIECKLRSNARLNQETIAGLAYRVRDAGASGAIIVTTIGLQEGAARIASHEGFHEVYLSAESTFEQFVARCCKRVLVQLSDRAAVTFLRPIFEITESPDE